MEFTALGLWESMGLAARAVVIILAFLSVYSFAIMIERGMLLRQARLQSQAFADLIGDSDSVDDVVAQTQSPELGKHCYLAQVVGEALEEARELVDEGNDAAAVATAEAVVTRAVTVTVAILRKHLVQLASTAAGAPFLGLFGTGLGLIRAFQTIATTRSGGLTSVAAGIAELFPPESTRERKVIFDGDEKARYEHVVHVMDILRKQGIEAIGIR